MSKNNTVFIGENKNFWDRNRRSGGYLLKRRAGQITVSVVRALLLFGLCFMIIQPLLTRFSIGLMQEKDLYDSTVVLLPRNVTVDNYRGAYMGTEYLYRLGHRRILYFGRRKGSTTHQLRSEGYRAACADFGLEPRYLNNAFSVTSIKNGYQLARQLFSQPLKETAVFAATDTNALGILQAAEELGIRIPDDISLLGFDNIRDSGLPRIGLTTVEQPKKLLASMAVDSLLDKIENEQAGYTHRILAPGLVERSTCRAVEVTDG
jgi:DNA-binding LacI/PurR family transcriptional regulator